MDINVTYAELGASLVDPMPPGFNHLRYETFIGYGATTMEVATQAVLSFDLYREMGLGAELNGQTVIVKIGFLRAPCQLLWTESTLDRSGFTYGTLRGHPECGEETFILTHTAEDQVWLQIRSFSRPARWYAYLAAPVIPLLQRQFARRAGRALRAIVDRARVNSPVS